MRYSGHLETLPFQNFLQPLKELPKQKEELSYCVWGSEKLFQAYFSKKIKKIWKCQETLPSLENLKVELHLLRSCLSLCKIGYLLRTVPPDKAPSQLHEFDVNLRRSLEGIVGSSISDSAWCYRPLSPSD